MAALNGGTATVHNGRELLTALLANTGKIELAADIYLTPADWNSFTLPINISAVNRTVLIEGGGGQNRTLDWGFAVGLLSVHSNATLALNHIYSKSPGNRTQGVEQLAVEVRGSVLWPTVTGENGHKGVIANGTAEVDNANCNPDFVQVEVARIQKQLSQYVGAQATSLVTYEGGVSVAFVNVPYPAPLYSMLTKEQVGAAMYILQGLNTTCHDSRYVANAPASDGGGGGVPGWVWAVVGPLLGLLCVAFVLIACMWRRRRLARRRLAAAGFDEERAGSNGGSKAGSAADLASLPSKLGSGAERGLSGQGSSELGSQFLRTRFGPIDGVQLGELLGRGSFGRVYRGRWKGAVVAVKVIDHRVQQGKTHDLSREPLLSAPVDHPSLSSQDQPSAGSSATGSGSAESVVKASAGSGGKPARSASGGSAAAKVGPGGSAGSGGKAGRSGSGQLVPNLDGSGLVELVSPNDVLQPGHYEAWIISELCDRGSLSDLIHSGRLGGLGSSGGRAHGTPNGPAAGPAAGPGQRDVWVLLCLLDVALGLEYLHSNMIVHGDLKPANVLLRAARNDRRGFVCKLGDFGLSRMLAADQSHVETQSYGTASYAAPELLSQGKLSSASDIFSLGIIVWETVTAGELWPGQTVMQVIVQVSQQQARPELPPDFPPALASLAQRCWHEDPAQRPKAAEIVEELRKQVMEAMRQAQPPPQAVAVSATNLLSS